MNDQRKRTQRLRLVILVLFGALLVSGLYNLVLTRESQRAQAMAMEAAMESAGDAQRLAEHLRDAQARYDALEAKYEALQARLKEIEEAGDDIGDDSRPSDS